MKNSVSKQDRRRCKHLVKKNVLLEEAKGYREMQSSQQLCLDP